MRYKTAKRLFDLAVSVPALILSLPLQVAVAVAVALKLGRPVLFRQIRPGQHSVPFELIKFRTMMPIDPTTGRTDDGSRMTRLGRILRSTSLDELPSLWNVVRGDMSVVGPRPLLMQYLDRYTPMQARRHEVKPGLTGLAQISGRNAISWEDKFGLDIKYVNDPTMGLDLRILTATVVMVLGRKGITADGHSTAPEFLVDPLLNGEPAPEQGMDYRRPPSASFSIGLAPEFTEQPKSQNHGECWLARNKQDVPEVQASSPPSK